MHIPFALPDIGPAEIAAVTACLKSGWVTSGPNVKEFEQKFADYVGARHAIAVNSATMGALLILDALGVGPGSEVIVPAYTFSGPAMMAHKLGAKVLLADCLPGSYQIDPADVERKLTDDTLVVMPTHFAGAMCDMNSLAEICGGTRVHLIDDAAHAFPTFDYAENRMVGSGESSKATFFSFYATKCLTTGEGGMVTTSDTALADRIRALRVHGFSRAVHDRYTNLKTGWRYDIAAPGWKANMTDTAAAMGLVQLERAAEMRTARSNIATLYHERLGLLAGLELPQLQAGPAWHLFPIQVRHRGQFVAGMGERGFQCSVHFIPLHLHSFWSETLGVKKGDRPNAEKMFAGAVSLPTYSKMTRAEVNHVIEAVIDVLGGLPDA